MHLETAMLPNVPAGSLAQSAGAQAGKGFDTVGSTVEKKGHE